MANNVISSNGKQKISKKELGEKQFSTRIKKASKLFSRNIEKIRKKKKNKEGKTAVLEINDGVLIN